MLGPMGWTGSFLIVVILIGIFFLWLAWWLGSLLGKSVTRGVGIIIGISAIVIGLFTVVGIPIGILFGIAVIIKSKDNEAKELASTYSNSESTETRHINQMNKFMGKNYKDILADAGLSDYCEIFEKHKLTDLQTIMSLSSEELKEIGVESIGDRKRIIAAFSIDKVVGEDTTKHVKKVRDLIYRSFLSTFFVEYRKINTFAMKRSRYDN